MHTTFAYIKTFTHYCRYTYTSYANADKYTQTRCTRRPSHIVSVRTHLLACRCTNASTHAHGRPRHMPTDLRATCTRAAQAGRTHARQANTSAWAYMHANIHIYKCEMSAQTIAQRQSHEYLHIICARKWTCAFVHTAYTRSVHTNADIIWIFFHFVKTRPAEWRIFHGVEWRRTNNFFSTLLLLAAILARL